MDKLLWWGYVHTNGSIQVKRYFSELDIDEARESPFVKSAYGPWDCKNREEAIAKVRNSAMGKEV